MYLIKDNALNDLCGKTLGILSFCSVAKKLKSVFARHFGGDDQNNVILAPLVDCHDLGRIVSGEPSIHIDFELKKVLLPPPREFCRHILS